MSCCVGMHVIKVVKYEHKHKIQWDAVIKSGCFCIDYES